MSLLTNYIYQIKKVGRYSRSIPQALNMLFDFKVALFDEPPCDAGINVLVLCKRYGVLLAFLLVDEVVSSATDVLEPVGFNDFNHLPESVIPHLHSVTILSMLASDTYITTVASCVL